MCLNMWKKNVVNIVMFFDVRSQKVPTSFFLLFDFCVPSSLIKRWFWIKEVYDKVFFFFFDKVYDKVKWSLWIYFHLLTQKNICWSQKVNMFTYNLCVWYLIGTTTLANLRQNLTELSYKVDDLIIGDPWSTCRLPWSSVWHIKQCSKKKP